MWGPLVTKHASGIRPLARELNVRSLHERTANSSSAKDRNQSVPDRLQCRAAGRGQVSANTVGLAVTKLSDRQELAQGSEAQYGDADERPGCRDLRDVETARACSS